MQFAVRPVEYFSGMLASDAQEAGEWLANLAEGGVNLLAFSETPTGEGHTRVTVFPEDSARFLKVATGGDVQWTGPDKAFLVQGDDRLGAAAEIYGRLARAGVEVYSSTGVTDGRGGFGYLIYVRAGDFDRAEALLKD